MLDHPFRTLGLLIGLIFVCGLLWAVTLGGFSLNDPELEDQMAWVGGFKHDQPELAREMGRKCKDEIGRSPWTRDGALALFTCIRGKAEAQGFAYE